MGQYTQKTFEGKKRLSVDVDVQLMRLVKSKAALQGRTVTDIIDDLLRKWVNGRLVITSDDKAGK